MLNTHQKYLIVNLANELGFYEWDADPDQALADFVTAYKNAISTIRQVLHVPIMIDAPDGGTRLDVWNTIGQDLIDHDPDHNLLLSAHAYWAAHDWTSEIVTAISSKLPIVFGEIANSQDEDGDPCHYCLTDADPPASGFTYQKLLKKLQNDKVGWLAWSWGPDQCASRQVSSDGTLSGLTTYGKDLAQNTTYGWMATAIKSSAF
jgi:mannan endo-1,4-beta-mannosidase